MQQNTALGLKAKQKRKMGCAWGCMCVCDKKKLGGSAMLLKWPRNRIECTRALSENERKAKQQQQQHQLRMNEWRFCTNRREMGIGTETHQEQDDGEFQVGAFLFCFVSFHTRIDCQVFCVSVCLFNTSN